jgi:hypothetical protein
MPEPLRERALAALVTELETITGTRPWGGSYLNTPVVERRYKTPMQVTQFPALLVLEGPGSTFEIAGVDGMFEHKLRVVIYGYVQGDDQTLRTTWLQRLWDDVITVLQANRILGGLSSDIDILELETDEGELEPLGAFAQTIAVTLFESKTVS